MTLAGVEARHPWIDRRMRITGFEAVRDEKSWRTSNLLLGPAVLQVIQHLQLHPPQILQFVDPGLINIQKRKPQANGINHPPPPAYETTVASSANRPTLNNSRTGQAPPPPSIIMPKIAWPTIPSEFPAVNSCSLEELNRIKDDELELRAFCNRQPITKQLDSVQSKLLAENANEAAKRCDLEKEMKELHQQVSELQTELKKKIEIFQNLEKQQDKLCKPTDTRQLRSELTIAKKEAFEQSEAIADSWLEGNNDEDVDTFLDRFLAARKVHHVRAAKLEILR